MLLHTAQPPDLQEEFSSRLFCPLLRRDAICMGLQSEHVPRGAWVCMGCTGTGLMQGP